MVRRFDRVWLDEADKKLAKANASLQGMKLSDYLGQRIRDDTKEFHQELEEKNRSLPRRPAIGFFR